MKSEWASFSLGELADFIDYRGKTPPKTTFGIPLVTAKIVKDNVIQKPTEFISKDLYDNWMTRGIPKYGNVVFTTEAPLGEVAQIKTTDKLAFAQRIIILQGKNGVLDDTFLFYALQYEPNKKRIEARSSGTTVFGIKSAELKKVLINVPHIDEQIEIGRTLSALDAKIAANTAINHNLEQIAQAIFKSWFVDFEPCKPFTEVVHVLGGGTPKTTTNEYWEGSIPFFTPKDALANYVLETEKTLTESGLKNCNSRLYPVNTVFVTARGTVGKIALSGVPMAMNQSCYALIGNEGYGQYFVYHLVLEVVKNLKKKASGAVFDAIVTRDFEGEIVSAPPIEDIRDFEYKVASIYEAILNNLKESARLAAIRDALLPKLMSGEIEIK